MIATRARLKSGRRVPSVPRGFTLTELLVAMAIIVVIAGVTAVGIRTLARDAKLASATNTVIAGLDTARGIAIRDNRLTALVIRPRLDGNRQYVELTVAQWSGQSPTITVAGGVNAIDRFVPVHGIAVRRLPTGIKVAGPAYGSSAANMDESWQTQSHFPVVSEARGYLLGVMFAGDGTVATRNSAMDSQRMYVDFNDDNLQQTGGGPIGFPEIMHDESPTVPANLTLAQHNNLLFLHHSEEAEPYVSLAAFLAVFDDDRCRDAYDTSSWSSQEQRLEDYTEYITNNADRIHFNRYTGVVTR